MYYGNCLVYWDFGWGSICIVWEDTIHNAEHETYVTSLSHVLLRVILYNNETQQ